LSQEADAGVKRKVHHGRAASHFQTLLIADDGVNERAAWHSAVHGGGKPDELLMRCLFMQRFITVPSRNLTGFKGRPGWVRSKAWIWLFSAMGRPRVSWRVHVESGDVLAFPGEFRIDGALECTKPMRLQAIGQRQTLDGAQRNPLRFSVRDPL
jgi:hypothetical protein